MKWFVFVLHSLLIAQLVLVGSVEMVCADDVAKPLSVTFNKDVRPILTTHCTACHGGVKQAADLSFVYADQMMHVVEPGNADDSYLIERVISDDEDDRMPPADHGRKLNDNEIEILQAWINAGAKWEEHWAYQQPQRHQAMVVDEDRWVLQPVDAFVLEKLETAGVRPAEDETPLRLLRRVCLDLTGLPPTMAMREAYLSGLNTNPERAYEEVVDTLLASPHFGERWASVWLDQVRYADSKGLGLDRRRSMWKYRDWVIDAFNQDMTYDQFTIKQMAGDLLPDASLDDQIATAVHRLTQCNDEGGTDDEEFRVAAVLDRVSTTWQAWQGTTFGCVQCHSHPYDPIRHEEFYQFVAYFNNSIDMDLASEEPLLEIPNDRKLHQKSGELQAQRDEAVERSWQSLQAVIEEIEWNVLPLSGVSSSTGTLARLEQDSCFGRQPGEACDQFVTSGTLARDTKLTLSTVLPEGMKSLSAVRLNILPFDVEKAYTDSEWGFVLSHVSAQLISARGEETTLTFREVIADEPDPIFNPQESLNPKTNRGFGAYTRIHYPRNAVFVLEDATKLSEGATLEITLDHRVFENASFPLVSRRGYVEVFGGSRLHEVLNSPKTQQTRQEIQKLNASLAKMKGTTVPVLRERRDEFSRPTHVFIRGLFLTKGDQVFADVPELLKTDDETISDRLELAEWMVSQDNPLTARVAVNRFWARLFGAGLVVTEEDFGTSGDPPVLPELLDDLSVRFRDDYGWSVKKLLRELVLSHTYRQSSKVRTDVPADRALLARGPSTSLPAEMMRDQALAISGLLNETVFGPPAYPPLPEGVWNPFQQNEKWPTPPPGDPERYRRAIYTSVKRSIPYPLMATFDAPTREFCTPRRLTSNTPLQSLTLLNDEVFVECTQGLAKRMTESHSELLEQISAGFVFATGREGSDREIAALEKLHNAVATTEGRDAAMYAVAGVLLNLDEVLTK